MNYLKSTLNTKIRHIRNLKSEPVTAVAASGLTVTGVISYSPRLGYFAAAAALLLVEHIITGDKA